MDGDSEWIEARSLRQRPRQVGGDLGLRVSVEILSRSREALEHARAPEAGRARDRGEVAVLGELLGLHVVAERVVAVVAEREIVPQDALRNARHSAPFQIARTSCSARLPKDLGFTCLTTPPTWQL